jgi:hypothetical protein
MSTAKPATTSSTTKDDNKKNGGGSTGGNNSLVTILFKLFALIDSIVELYLGKVIKPFLSLHETFYTALNRTLRKILDDNASKIPTWFTANFITYARTVLVVPTLLLLAWDCTWLPSFIVILVDFGDFLDGVVARFWVDTKAAEEANNKDKDKSTRDRAPSPTQSDDDSFGTCFLLECMACLLLLYCYLHILLLNCIYDFAMLALVF